MTLSFFLISYFIFHISFHSFAQEKLFKNLPASHTGITFSNDIVPTPDVNIINPNTLNSLIGGGVAIGDINNDGLQDIYFAGNQVSGKL